MKFQIILFYWNDFICLRPDVSAHEREIKEHKRAGSHYIAIKFTYKFKTLLFITILHLSSIFYLYFFQISINKQNIHAHNNIKEKFIEILVIWLVDCNGVVTAA